MLSKLRERSGSESGFTLVELLVVMLILGILAAIAIPTFFNQRTKAQDADAKAVARTAQTAMETYATDNNGQYTGATDAALEGIEDTLSASNWTIVGAPGADSYTVRATSASGNTFDIARAAGGAFSFACATAGEGGCPAGGGGWGG